METPALRRPGLAFATDSKGATVAFDVDLIRRDPGGFHADEITVLITENIHRREDAAAGQSQVESARVVKHTVKFTLQIHQRINGIERRGKTEESHTNLLVTAFLFFVFIPLKGEGPAPVVYDANVRMTSRTSRGELPAKLFFAEKRRAFGEEGISAG